MTVLVVIAPDSTEEAGLAPISIAAARGKRAPETDGMGRTRLGLRAWEWRRRLAGRAVIAASFPIAYLLLIGSEAPGLAVRIALGLWLVTLSAAAICAEAVWRHRYRLEQGIVDRAAPTIRPIS